MLPHYILKVMHEKVTYTELNYMPFFDCFFKAPGTTLSVADLSERLTGIATMVQYVCFEHHVMLAPQLHRIGDSSTLCSFCISHACICFEIVVSWLRTKRPSKNIVPTAYFKGLYAISCSFLFHQGIKSICDFDYPLKNYWMIFFLSRAPLWVTFM